MTTTTYLWDTESDNLLSEDDGTTTTNYTNEPGQFGHLVSQNNSLTANTNFYHFDARGDSRELTDGSETVTATRLYDAWGNVIGSTGTTPMPFEFVGRIGYVNDHAINRHYVRARWYTSSTMWQTTDPLLFADGPNIYAYAGNNPVNRLDPTGLSSGDDSENPLAVTVHSKGSCDGCIVLFCHGANGNANDKNSGMYLAAKDAVASRHFVANVTHDADISSILDKVIKARCCCRSCPTKSVCVVLAGHSLGGDKAIEMADWFEAEIKAKCKGQANTKSKISLVTIDAIQRNTAGLAVSTGPTATMSTFLNFFQTKDMALGNLKGGKITGAVDRNVSSGRDPLGAWMKANLTGRQATTRYHQSIDNFLATSTSVGGKKLGTWAKDEADALDCF